MPDTQAAYEAWKASRTEGDCVFCEYTTGDTSYVLQEYSHFLLTTNRFPYAVWDDRQVTNHRMLIPKRHLMKLRDFTSDESTEFLQLLSEFEDQGFSVYSRAQQDPSRSITHQHTHLFQLVL